MPLSCSLFYLQSARGAVFHPLYVGRIAGLSSGEILSLDKRGIHVSPVGGRASCPDPGTRDFAHCAASSRAA